MKYFPQVLIGVSALAAILALVFYFQQTSPETTDQAPQPVTVVNETPEPAATSLDEEETAQEQSEDDIQEATLAAQGMGINLARIRPDGSAIVAGNAMPGSTINLIKDGKIIGRATASDQGEWVIIPDVMLGQGSHLLSIEIINPDGSKKIGDMALAIEMIDDQETPLVALVPYTENASEAATLLQAPEAIEETIAAPIEATEDEASTIAAADTEANTGVNPAPLMPRVTIRSLQALNPKTFSVSGLAEGGASVELMVNGKMAAEAKPDDRAMYAMIVPIDPSQDRLRLKSILRDGANNQIASASINLTKSQLAEGLSGNALIVVQKGDALWRIAYKTYGAGIRYVDIVRQNSTKITDPDLIYPDQIFVIPNG